MTHVSYDDRTTLIPPSVKWGPHADVMLLSDPVPEDQKHKPSNSPATSGPMRIRRKHTHNMSIPVE